MTQALLANESNYIDAPDLAGAVARLAQTAEEQAQARQALLRLLAGTTHPWEASGLADAVARLSPDVEELAQVRGGAAHTARQPAPLPHGLAADGRCHPAPGDGR